MENKMLTLEKFEEASEVVKQVTQETKLVYSDFYSAQTGNKVYLKPENMQFTGAYKLRGAYYKLSTLTKEEREKALQETIVKVKTHSIDYRTMHLEPTDIIGLQKLMEEKRKLDDLKKLHISIE